MHPQAKSFPPYKLHVFVESTLLLVVSYDKQQESLRYLTTTFNSKFDVVGKHIKKIVRRRGRTNVLGNIEEAIEKDSGRR